jgi:AraC family transcriptional regulator
MKMPENDAATTSLPSALGGEGRAWRHIGAARLRRSVDEISLPALSEHVVLVNLGRPYRLEEKLDGRVYRTSGVRGDVAILPAGTPVESRSREREPQEAESLAVRLDPAFLRGIAADADMDPVELVGVLGGRDPEIERIGSSLLSELENDGLFGDLYADSLATALVVRLLRDHSSLGRRAARKVEPPKAGFRRRRCGGSPTTSRRTSPATPR